MFVIRESLHKNKIITDSEMSFAEYCWISGIFENSEILMSYFELPYRGSSVFQGGNFPKHPFDQTFHLSAVWGIFTVKTHWNQNHKLPISTKHKKEEP